MQSACVIQFLPSPGLLAQLAIARAELVVYAIFARRPG
jgi:hypothetical protein